MKDIKFVVTSLLCLLHDYKKNGWDTYLNPNSEVLRALSFMMNRF